MSTQTKRVLGRFLIFALIGLLMEVFFTALGGLKRGNFNLHGGTSPWMMIDYGLLGIVLMPMARPMIRRGIPLVLRAVVYMIGIFFVEFVSGWIFDLCHIKIWNYSHLPYNLYGYITLMYAPFWYALGLGVEYLYTKVDTMALVLALGLNADQIEARTASRK